MSLHDVENLIIKHTSISAEQLNALLSQTNQGETLRDFLHRKEFKTAEEALAELCQQIGSQFIKEIPIGDISVDLIRDIPINYAKTHEVLPFKEEQDRVVILMSNPLNFDVLSDMKVLFRKRIHPLITTSYRLEDAINRVYEKSTAALEGLDQIDEDEYDLEDSTVDLLEAGEDDAPVIKLVNTLLFRAAKEKASDIHI